MNIAEILKDCPKGTKLYSPIFGDVILDGIDTDSEKYPICIFISPTSKERFTSDGRFYFEYEVAKCMLFPSKENRDWSTFKIPKKEYDFKPFDKVLVRDRNTELWSIDLFSYIANDDDYKYACLCNNWKKCIPYEGNEHLLNTNKNPE